MSTLTVTAKGQATLKKDVLQHLGIVAGSRISVHKLPNGRIEIEAEKPSGKISDVFGMLKRDGQPPVSIEDMNEVIAKGWAKGWAKDWAKDWANGRAGERRG